MKSLYLLCSLFLLAVQCIFAQTNTFPSSGNVGIGTTTPLNALDVNGNINLNNREGTSPGFLNSGYYVYKMGTTVYGMKLQFTNGRYGTMIFGPNQPDRFISFGKAGNALTDDNMLEYMRIDLNNGNVGIGTSVASDKLTINGNINATGKDRRLYMGGVANTTFGIAYSPEYPNYGIFYTEGAIDHVSISPNGNVGQGVLNVFGDGKVGIGTTTTGSHKLAVEGSIGARQVKVEANSWSDFVFEPDYKLRSLEEVQDHIKSHGHLPDVPSAKEVQENGIDLGKTDALLLQKIEELTLYLLQQEVRIKALEEDKKKLEEKLK